MTDTALCSFTMTSRSLLVADVCVVGGGVIGSSIALQLALRRRDLRIVVLEQDSTYRKSSTALSAGGIRQQFTIPENVALSVYGAWWIKHGLQQIVEEASVDFVECGYLTLANDVEALKSARETQRSAGANWTTLLLGDELRSRFPWINADNVAAGVFGERNEGYFDAYSLLCYTKMGAQRMGVDFVQERATRISDSEVETVNHSVSAGQVVLACGAHSAQLLEVPVRPRKRCVFAISCDQADGCPPPDAPLMFDTTGVYFRSDRSQGNFICGVSPAAEDDVDVAFSDGQHELCVDYDLFQENIWPALAHRVPAFEALKVRSAWAGLYEYNVLDQNGIVGFGHPKHPNVLIATGFSGHGLQHAPGIGRACAELIDARKFETLDLTRLGYGRIRDQIPFRELAIY